MYKNPALTDLGYPDEFQEMYAIRRGGATDVFGYLIAMMEKGDPPASASRLPRDKDYFLLPRKRPGDGKIELVGHVSNLPSFIEVANSHQILVKCTGLVLLNWQKDGQTVWFMVPPGPEPLREDAGKEPDQEKKARLLKLAEWIERIPLSSPAGPDAV